MNALLSMKVVPVLNGNDVVAPAPQIGSDLENVSEASVHMHESLKMFIAVYLSCPLNSQTIILLFTLYRS